MLLLHSSIIHHVQKKRLTVLCLSVQKNCNFISQLCSMCMFEFVKVMPKVLSVHIFPSHGVEATEKSILSNLVMLDIKRCYFS